MKESTRTRESLGHTSFSLCEGLSETLAGRGINLHVGLLTHIISLMFTLLGPFYRGLAASGRQTHADGKTRELYPNVENWTDLSEPPEFRRFSTYVGQIFNESEGGGKQNIPHSFRTVPAS